MCFSSYSRCLYLYIRYLPPVASAPANLMAVQEGLTSIRVSWSPPTPLGDTTGYRIYYSGGNSENVSDSSTNNSLLTGLQNGDSYTVSIVATSQHFFSGSVTVVRNFTLSETITQCYVVLDVQTCMTVYISSSLSPSSRPA